MRVAITGATGNVGLALIRALERDDAVESIVGLARRVPTLRPSKVTWRPADVTDSELVEAFRGADAVVHLAWLIQPSHDQARLRRANVDGSARAFRAAAEAGVDSLVYASSVGAYSPGPKNLRVGEEWPTDGIATSFYSRHKAEVESLLDRFQAEHPGIRVVRLRPALIFQRAAASEIRRYFAGPLLPGRLLTPRLIPVVPRIERLRFQAVHADDVAEAYRRAIASDASGAFNIAAEPPLDPATLGRLLGARPVPVPARALRAAAALTWRLRLQPTPPGWLDMALAVPLMDSSRAERELGWHPRRSSEESLIELLEGLRERAGAGTPPLEPKPGGGCERASS